MSIQHVPTSLLPAYSMYQHYHCQHTARTNTTTVRIRQLTMLLLSSYIMYQHYYCQYTACTNTTTFTLQHVPKFLLPFYRIFQTLSVSTRHSIQHVALFPICVTQHSDIATHQQRAYWHAELRLNVVLHACPTVQTESYSHYKTAQRQRRSQQIHENCAHMTRNTAGASG